MFSDNPNSEFHQRSRSLCKRKSNRGFTLIELLVVIGIILILASITFGISRGVQNAQARTKVRADLAVIAQALEQFKSVHGEYPSTTSGTTANNKDLLWYALHGQMTFYPVGHASYPGLDFRAATGRLAGDGGRIFIDDEVLTTDYDSEDNNNDATDFLDPWGQPYYYDFRVFNGTWDNVGYILYSAGPDGDFEPVGSDGMLTPGIREEDENLDNIYLGD